MKKNYYQHNGIEAIDIIKKLGLDLHFSAGNFIKYHFRKGKKSELDELEKIVRNIINKNGNILITNDNISEVFSEIKNDTLSDDLKKADYYYNLLNDKLKKQVKNSLAEIGLDINK